MPMLYLLNSAVVTAPGLYRYRHIGPAEARLIYRAAPPGERASGVGYAETARVMEHILGLRPGEIEVTRATTIMAPGDRAIVFRLTRRLPDAALKGRLTEAELIAWPHELGLLERLE